jgi:hypothetical protein
MPDLAYLAILLYPATDKFGIVGSLIWAEPSGAKEHHVMAQE